MDDLHDMAKAILGADRVEAVLLTVGPGTDLTGARDALLEQFTRYVTDCAAQLGCDAAELLGDPCWFFCMDDGLTPTQAVDAYKGAANAE